MASTRNSGPLHEVEDMLLRIGVRCGGHVLISEDLGSGGCREVGAVLDLDRDEGFLRGDQAGLLNPGAVAPQARGAIVFAMFGCDGGVR